MKRTNFLKGKIALYLKREQLIKGGEYIRLTKSFLEKSRKNFSLAGLLLKISDEDELKKALNLSSGFEVYDWVIIVAYYSMYASALAALSKLGFKSKSHAATITVLEHYYIIPKQDKGEDKTKTLGQEDIHKLVKAHAMSEQLIIKLIQTKTKRESAQYDATPAISRENALSAVADADEFITKIEEILS